MQIVPRLQLILCSLNFLHSYLWDDQYLVLLHAEDWYVWFIIYVWLENPGFLHTPSCPACQLYSLLHYCIKLINYCTFNLSALPFRYVLGLLLMALWIRFTDASGSIPSEHCTRRAGGWESIGTGTERWPDTRGSFGCSRIRTFQVS